MKNYVIGHDTLQKDDPNYCSLIDELRLKLREEYAMIVPELLVPPMYRIFFRSFAIMTNGSYIFLTNNSGIGGSHLEPTDTDYDVEPLNECMIRVICEYCGIEYVPQYTYDPEQNPVQDPQQPIIEDPIYDYTTDEGVAHD